MAGQDRIVVALIVPARLQVDIVFGFFISARNYPLTERCSQRNSGEENRLEDFLKSGRESVKV